MSEIKGDVFDKYSPYVFGVDLGTSNSAVAIFKEGRVEVLPIEGTKMMPSVISVLQNGEILVGYKAKNRAIMQPENTVASIKRLIGDDKWKKTFEALPGKEYTPVDISTMILAEMIAKVQQNEGIDLKGTPRYAVICIPANFDNAKREATKKAAELANLEVLYLLEEPVAAAYAYALEKERDQTILIYDLGGGTFDVTILKIDSTQSKEKQFKVLAKEGVPLLGGDDFDQKLMEIVARKLQETSGLDILDLKKDQGINERSLREAQQKLKEAVMQAKHELSETMNTSISVPNLIKDESGKPHNIDMEVTREQFNDAIRDLILQSKEAVRKSLEAAKLTIKEIDRIILIGGSTRVPLVRERIMEMFGKEPYGDIDPDTAVARGAAIYGATLNAPVRRDEADILDIVMKIEDKVSHHLGIEVSGGKFSALIKKGTDIPNETPVAETKEYTTPRDNMTELAIRVYQSLEEVEFVSSKDVVCIGEFFLTGIPPKPRGQERITVTFEINQQNILHVKAKGSSSEKDLEIKRS